MAYIDGKWVFTKKEHFPQFFQEIYMKMEKKEAARQLDLAYQEEVRQKGIPVIGSNAMQMEIEIDKYLAQEKKENKYKISKKASEKAMNFIKSIHHEDDGFITIFQKENVYDKDTNSFIMVRKSHYHYTLSELEEKSIRDLTRKNNDVYFSINSFFQTQRRVNTLRKINALYLDIDKHDVDKVSKAEIDKLIQYYEDNVWGENGVLPPPSIISFTGRGIQIYWTLSSLPKQGLAFWQLLEDRFCQELDAFNAFGFKVDKSATDVTRVLRLVGTNHSIARIQAKIISQSEDRYMLSQIVQDYFPDLIIKPKSPKKTVKKIATSTEKATVSNQNDCFKKLKFKKNIYTLHYGRLQDIQKLQELRHYDCIGHRELMCFLFRYYSCLFCKDPEIALQDTLEFNRKFLAPLSENEVMKETESAEKAYYSWQNQNDLILEGKVKASTKNKTRLGYNYTNKKLIDILNITSDEQQHLSTIIGKEEKNERKKVKNKLDRRNENGLTPKQQELKDLKNKALILKEQGLSLRKIATEVNETVSKIQRALKSEY